MTTGKIVLRRLMTICQSLGCRVQHNKHMGSSSVGDYCTSIVSLPLPLTFPDRNARDKKKKR